MMRFCIFLIVMIGLTGCGMDLSPRPEQIKEEEKGTSIFGGERGINLTKIESRPRRNRPWQYLFYLDFEGHWQDPAAEAALMSLLRRSSFVKLVGSYPSAMTPFDDDF